MPHTVAFLLYGAGLRLLDALRLRVKDVDLDRRELAVRDTIGKRDRVTVVPRVADDPLRSTRAPSGPFRPRHRLAGLIRPTQHRPDDR